MAKRAKREDGDSKPAGAGHNSFTAGQLRSFVERIERLEEEKKALTADISEVYSEAKGQGFDTKILREVVKLRKLDSYALQERQAILDLYMEALGMLADTPLGQAAMERAGSELADA